MLSHLNRICTVCQYSQGTKIFQYCNCPAGQVTNNFHSSCKHMHLSFKSTCNKEHKVVICNMTSKSTCPIFLYFTCNYKLKLRADKWNFCLLILILRPLYLNTAEYCFSLCFSGGSMGAALVERW